MADSEALMGEEDVDAIEDGLKAARRGQKGVMPEITPAMITKSVDWFKPDEEAYEPLEENEIKGFLVQAQEGQVEVEVHGISEAGTPFCASLSKDQVKEAFSAKGFDEVVREHFQSLHESGRLTSKAGYEDNLRESRKVPIELREDDFDTSGGVDWYGADANSLGQFDGTHEFLPLGNAPFNRQLYIHDQWDMQAKAFYARTHDPVAKRALTLIVDFVLGRAVKMVAESPLVQEWLEDFDRINKVMRKLPIWVEDQGCDGELFFRFFDTEEGPPRMTTLDPSSIWEIITDPENIDDVKFYWQQYQTAYQLIGNAPIRGDENIPEEDRRNPTTKYIIRYIPSSNVLHFKINASSVEKRGRSDLFPVLGWLYRLRKYYDAETIKSLMQAAFVFDILLKGGAPDAAAVQQFSSQVPAPDVTKAGSAFYHNEGVEVELLQGNKSATTSTGAIGIGDGLLGIIAIGLGFAKDYLGVTSRGSRATALVSTEPSAKHFEHRQRQLKYMLEDIARWVIEYGIKTGRLPKTERLVPKRAWRKILNQLFVNLRKFQFNKALHLLQQTMAGLVEQPLNKNVTFIFPDIVKADRSDLIDDIKKVEGMNWISKRRAAEMIAAALDIDDFNFDEEQEDIKDEGEQVIAKDQEQVRKGAPDPNDPAFSPSSVPNPADAPKQPSDGGSSSTDQKKGLADKTALNKHSDDNNQGGSRKSDTDIRKDLGPQNKESSGITIKINS